MKFIMLLNFKMLTIVGILTFKAENTAPESFKSRKNLNFSVFYFLSAFEISCSVELSMKKVYITLGSGWVR